MSQTSVAILNVYDFCITVKKSNWQIFTLKGLNGQYCLALYDNVRYRRASPFSHVSVCACVQTRDGASDDLVGEVGEDEDPGQSNSHQHPHIEQVGSSR